MAEHHHDKNELSLMLIHYLQHLVHISCEFINIFGAVVLITGAMFALINLSVIFFNSFIGTRFRMWLVNKHGHTDLSEGEASESRL
jgi:hypothetical protein